MASGALDRRITIERFTSEPDAWNEPVPTWSILAEVWASYTPLSDGERQRADEVAASATARFQIRYAAAVRDANPKDRVQFDGQTFAIVHVKTVGRRNRIEITARARAD